MNRHTKWIRRAIAGALMALAPLFAPGCTDLSETPKDALTPDNAFKTDAEVLAGVASVYAGLRGMMWAYWNLSEISTDELLVPTRGNDWGDNGRWLEIHRQAWAPNSGSALDDMNGMWNDLFSGVARANLMIGVLEKGNSATKDVTIAELRTLRAWYYYMLQSMFGGLPLVTTTEVAQRERVGRDSIFRFIERELNDARTKLPKTWSAAEYGRVTQGAADAILAGLYLNAGVFSKNTGVSATSYNSCTVAVTGGTGCAAAIAAADRVINSGTYSLATDWKKNFSIDNEGSPENVFVLVHTAQAGLGMSLQMRPLHYNQLVPAPWNGFAALADTYRAFDANDERRNIFLVGQQYSYNTGQAVTDRNNQPLIFTVDISDIEHATEAEGPRLMKYPPLPGAPAGDAHPNDFVFYRLADMYLIKAEAQNESGQTAAAITLINTIRARHITPASPLGAGLTQAQVRDAILRERLFEFAGEAKRREDLIRHGHFLDVRRDCTQAITACTKPARTADAFRILMPIPQTQIQNNPKLTQNTGY